jgi:outer membrane protein assembly factor BamB
MRIVNGVPQAEGAPQQGLLTVDEAVQNALTDFDRHAQRGDFQKAFRVLENLPLEKRVGMLPAGNGFMTPARVRFWRLLVDMNAEGRAAFRLFYEPKAKQLFERMKTELETDRNKAIATATEIYEQYFITSYGDDAGQILGDASFEKGDFVEAATRWRSIIDYHAETDLPLPKIMAKCAAAYVGAGRATDARIILADVQRRYPAEKVRIAGQDQIVAEYIQGLLGTKADAPQVAAAAEAKLELPAQLTCPYWQMSFMSKKGQAAMQAAMSQNYYYKTGLETMIPNHVADKERVYLNWMGIVFAVDVASGKLAWRNDSFDKLHPLFSQMQQGRVNPASYGIQVVGDRVLASAVPLDRLNYWQPAVPITAYNSKTGEKAWSMGGDQGGQMSFLGQMYPYKDGVLTVSHTQQQTNMQLNFLNLSNGTSQWTMPLGTMQAQNNPYSGGQTFPSPDFGEVGRYLCLMNNSGAVLQINPDEKKVEGQFVMYEPKQTTDGSYYYYNGDLPEEKRLHTQGRMLVRDGYLIFKEVGKSELFCIDVQSQKVLWKRPISSTAMVVEADDEHVYTMNTELSAYSRVDGKLKWSVRLPVAGGGLSIVLSGDSAYAATQRGIFQVNRHTGKVLRVVRTAETNSPGMGMRLVGDKLITISSNSITCYRLTPPADAPQ